VTDELGAQGTICAGGRYDGLIEQLGGRPNTAVGFALGLDRVVLLFNKIHESLVESSLQVKPDVYFVMVGEEALTAGFRLAEQARNEINDIDIAVNCGGGSFKSQMKRADKSGADIAVLLGEDELNSQQVTIKYLREEGKQIRIDQSKLFDFLKEISHNKSS
jgi:histidyl-tRNA synthetase